MPSYVTSIILFICIIAFIALAVKMTVAIFNWAAKKEQKPKPEQETSKTFFDKTEESLEELSEPDILFTGCGHYGAEKFRLIFWDLVAKEINPGLIKKSILGKKTIDAPCHKCNFEYLKKHAIRCAVCGTAITPGESVALYSERCATNKKAATHVGSNVIGCMRWECCPSGGFFAGHWTESGFRPAFEHGCAAEEAMATGKMILIDEGGKKITKIDPEKK